MSWALLILLAAILSALAWLLRRPDGPDLPEPPSEDEEMDPAVLADAEMEVQDVDAFASPEDADDELRDWGPGAPNP